MSRRFRLRVVAGLLFVAFAPTVRADADPWFARDKYHHLAATAALSAAAYAVAAALDAAPEHRLWAGGLTAMGVGVAKECWDLSGRGDPSWRDLSWDAGGTATGLLTAWWVDYWWRNHGRWNRRAAAH